MKWMKPTEDLIDKRRDRVRGKQHIRGLSTGFVIPGNIPDTAVDMYLKKKRTRKIKPKKINTKHGVR